MSSQGTTIGHSVRYKALRPFEDVAEERSTTQTLTVALLISPLFTLVDALLDRCRATDSQHALREASYHLMGWTVYSNRPATDVETGPMTTSPLPAVSPSSTGTRTLSLGPPNRGSRPKLPASFSAPSVRRIHSDVLDIHRHRTSWPRPPPIPFFDGRTFSDHRCPPHSIRRAMSTPTLRPPPPTRGWPPPRSFSAWQS